MIGKLSIVSLTILLSLLGLFPEISSRRVILGDSPAANDEVKTIPGFNGTVKFRHYSGYLESTQSSHIHYWFFESQRDPANDPLVVWMNGGPGCSSLLGALAEHGPFNLNADKTVSINPYSWNGQANMLYLESPAGVGFSYNDNGNYKTGDNETAEMNYGAVKSFLKKFPQFENNDFYVAGESYGGIYVPTLSKLVNDRGYPKNFIGFALGNAFLDAQLNFDTQLYFFYYHGIIDSQVWGRLLKSCCPGETNRIDGGYCDFFNPPNSECMSELQGVQTNINAMPLNLYNIYGTCDNGSGRKKFSFPVLTQETVHRSRYVMNSSRILKDTENPPCMNFDFMVEYLNQQNVKDALHVSPNALPWSPCSPVINGNYHTEYSTMHDIVKELISSGRRAVIYNGDIDAMCNYFGDEIFAAKLGFKKVMDYRPWMYDNQIAGMVKFYHKMAFVTVRGAGHTVPMDKPAQAKLMFDTFLNYKGDMMDGL